MPRSSPLRNALTKARDRVRWRTYATILGDGEAGDVFCQTLDEDKVADESLTGIAGRLNLEVPAEPEQSEKRLAKASHRKPKSAA